MGPKSQGQHHAWKRGAYFDREVFLWIYHVTAVSCPWHSRWEA